MTCKGSFAFVVFAVLTCSRMSVAAHEFDAIVYGGTASGVIAAVQARAMNQTVAIIEPSDRLGGMTSGGLGQTDIGHKKRVGGLAREFYRRIAQHYPDPAAWTFQQRSEYQAMGDVRTDPQDGEVMWTFEPSVTQAIFNRWIEEKGISVFYNYRLDRADGVKKTNQTITSITMESGTGFQGKVFIDASYEGDLMASAGVSYVVGRESADKYGETANGIRPGIGKHQLRKGISPYVNPQDASSGLLPGIDATGPGKEGHQDHRLQAYCFRLCLTDHPKNRRLIEKPADYDERQYELLFRNFEAGEMEVPWICTPMPNRKTDINNSTGFSTDFIGQNYDYPEASYERRQEIILANLSYTQGLLWTLANHPRVPKSVREEVGRWGLCRNEFTATNGWPSQLYIREARRMVREYVMTQHDCEQRTHIVDSVGMGSYMMDSHNVQRYVDKDRHVQNEGDVQEWQQMDAYPISYRSIVPKVDQCTNLLVPICLSASHIAYGSIRMEPVYMILGQSAGTAAALAINLDKPVQEIDFSVLKNRLLADGQILTR